MQNSSTNVPSQASISSDSPSYFSQYFQCQIKKAEERGEDPATATRTLYIDRDPVTFRDIALHLQGYHVEPRDGTHFVRLFADAQFYSCMLACLSQANEPLKLYSRSGISSCWLTTRLSPVPKLVSQLYEESIFVAIGHKEFQIPRDLFSTPGNSPNFFSLGFSMFFSVPGSHDLFPGLDREGLIRPPSMLPPAVPNRSAETFAELLHFLRGYPVEVRSEAHRSALLKDCRYFNFKGLEQRLVPHALGFNQARAREEIALRLEDILKSGISILPEPTAADPNAAWVNYARPYVDEKAAELVLEVGGEATKLFLNHAPTAHNERSHGMIGSSSSSSSIASVRAEFFRDARARLAKMLEVVATKLNLPPTVQPLGLLMAKGGASSQPATPGNTPLSDDLVRVVLEPETSITLDGRPWRGHMVATGADKAAAVAAANSAAPSMVFTGAGAVGARDGPDLMAEPADTGWPSDAAMAGFSSMPSSAGGMANHNNNSGSNSGQDSPMSITAGSGFPPSRKRKRVDSNSPSDGLPEEWVVRTGQWRLRIQGSRNGKAAVECVLVAVKLDAMTSEHARNAQRGFLPR
jgi:hypothetical protein